MIGVKDDAETTESVLPDKLETHSLNNNDADDDDAKEYVPLCPLAKLSHRKGVTGVRPPC